MVENRVGLPRAPIEERIVSSLVFPLQHLEVCLEQIDAGAVFEGAALDNFRSSNKACRNINIAVASFSGFVAARMLGTKADGFRGRMLKTGGLIALAHATYQSLGAYDKTQRQVKLDSKELIGKHDLTG